MLIEQCMWELHLGDSFIHHCTSVHESDNEHDRRAMSVYPEDEPGVVVGQVLMPQALSTDRHLVVAGFLYLLWKMVTALEKSV